MYIDDRPVAMHYATESNNCYWLFKIAYAEDLSDCSPGQLLIRYTLEYAIQHKLRSYEFLGSEENWIKRWTKTAWPTISIEVYPFSIPGLVALTGVATRYLSKKLQTYTLKCLRH